MIIKPALYREVMCSCSNKLRRKWSRRAAAGGNFGARSFTSFPPNNKHFIFIVITRQTVKKYIISNNNIFKYINGIVY